MRWVSILELIVAIDNVFRAAAHDSIGFEDSRETLRTFVKRMNRTVRVYTEDLESALWACNLLNEKGRFRHPQGMSFDQYLRKMLRGDSFNKTYNYIEGENGSIR